MAHYSGTWEKYRRRWNRNRILMWSFLPLSLGPYWASRFFGNSLAMRVLGVGLTCCWLLAWIVDEYEKRHFLCPRCGKEFGLGGPWFLGKPSPDACWHCGLPLFATDDRDWKTAQS